jgi:quinol monooxygenase YgiN
MGHLEVVARLKIRPGQVERFRAQVAEIVRIAREKDTQTLRYDWFIDEQALECEVHEVYVSEQGLIEHNQHIMGARELLFRESALDHRMAVYGEISQQLKSLFDKHAGGVSKFSFFQGLKQSPAV